MQTFESLKQYFIETQDIMIKNHSNQINDLILLIKQKDNHVHELQQMLYQLENSNSEIYLKTSEKVIDEFLLN